MNINKFLSNPKTGLYSVDKIYRKLKQEGYDESYADVKKHIDNLFFYQVNKNERKPKKFNTIYATEIFKSCQMDIMDYGRYEYNKYRYIFCFVDVYSRYGFAFPLTNHRTKTIIDKLDEIFEMVGIYPQNINCDLEFDTNEMQKYAEKHNINFYFSEPYDIIKNSIVERWNRTLAGLLQKYRTATKKYNWNTYLPDIVYNYNHTYHRTIKATPASIFEGEENNNQPISIVKHKLKVGDKVRIIIHKDAFTKGDVYTYSNDVYVVEKINGNKIYLYGKTKSYKPYELQKTKNIVEWNNPDDEERIYESNKRQKKHDKILNDLNIDKSNIVSTKRIRTQKKRDDFIY